MSRKLLLNTCLTIAAVGLGLYLSREPWVAYRDQKEKANRTTAEMLKVEKDKAELDRQRAKLETPMGQEEQAREAGYVKRGEEPLRAGG